MYEKSIDVYGDGIGRVDYGIIWAMTLRLSILPEYHSA